MNRKQFIGKTGSAFLMLLAGADLLANAKEKKSNNAFLFLEAEQFEELGGWDLDQQSMDQMGSPYLLAHGLGIPVADARTTVNFPSKGHYRIWVRTRDWVAPWDVQGAPGKFQVIINGVPIKEVFGTKGQDWHWHDGGLVQIDGQTEIRLHDLTGFEGRCDSILFCKDLNFKPTDEVAALTRFRRKLLGLPDKPKPGGHYDLIVVGGGMAGTCTALSAARNGLKVALVQDRPVLGGNGSSEVRVWPEGKTRQEPYKHVGDIVEELMLPEIPAPVYGSRNAIKGKHFGDERKLSIIKAESRISLLTEYRAIDVESSDNRILAVVIQHTKSALQKRLTADYFADCTGDASVGFLAGADFEISSANLMGSSNLWSVMDASEENEILTCECKDKTALTLAWEQGSREQPFPRCPWAIDLSNKPFPGRKNFKGQWGSKDPLGNLGGWFWESGFDKNPITDIEKIRDLNLRAMYGAWDALKNVDKLYPNHRLGWCAFIAGKRESRRLMGDVVLTAQDFLNRKVFEDAVFPCSWHIDLHQADKNFDEGLAGEEFISHASSGEGYVYDGVYWAPYRILYSRNIDNLFMAGRDISVSNDGLGPVRVMRTCGMMGEIVGKAATICVQKKTTPRGVYENHLAELKGLMNHPGTYRSS
ncbi:FAD-dependent oxidoreductase [Sphingobacterium sp.]|uniref:FAD-dependent oxidoreductase n=1 Tax=Sphingobacterium sp. TaxID=341027 RepID=UPI0031E2B01A